MLKSNFEIVDNVNESQSKLQDAERDQSMTFEMKGDEGSQLIAASESYLDESMDVNELSQSMR